MNCKIEPAIWSRDTSQWIPFFDSCQLIIVWMSNINEVHGKPRLCLFLGVWPPCWGQLRHRAYAPRSNTASHDNNAKISSWVSFAFGQPELRYQAFLTEQAW